MQEDFPKQIRHEQTAAAMVDFAKIVHSYFKALRDEGFSKAEAFEMVLAYQSEMLHISLSGEQS